MLSQAVRTIWVRQRIERERPMLARVGTQRLASELLTDEHCN
jgi:hypothetical protein